LCRFEQFNADQLTEQQQANSRSPSSPSNLHSLQQSWKQELEQKLSAQIEQKYESRMKSDSVYIDEQYQRFLRLEKEHLSAKSTIKLLEEWKSNAMEEALRYTEERMNFQQQIEQGNQAKINCKRYATLLRYLSVQAYVNDFKVDISFL
jgi:hypothetical protein